MQVNDLNLPDYPLTPATITGYPQYPPGVIVRNVKHSTHTDDEARMPFTPSPYFLRPTFLRDGGQSLQQNSLAPGSINWQQRVEFPRQQTHLNMGSHHNDQRMPMEMSLEPSGSNIAGGIAVSNSLLSGMEVAPGYSSSENMVNFNEQHTVATQYSSSAGVDGAVAFNSSSFSGRMEPLVPMRSAEGSHFSQYIPFSDLASWQLPFLQGWVMGQTHVGLNMMLHVNSALQGSGPPVSGSELVIPDRPLMHSVGTGQASSVMTDPSNSRDSRRNSSRHRSLSQLMFSTDLGEGTTSMMLNLTESA